MLGNRVTVISLLCFVGTSATAQSLDYNQARALSQPVSAAVTATTRWIHTLKPIDLTMQFDEGKNLEFWVEEAESHAGLVDSLLQEFRSRPRLIKLIDLVLNGRELKATLLTLGRELSDCHSCNDASRERAGAWASSSHDPLRTLSKVLWDLELEMNNLTRRAEALIEQRRGG